MKKIIVLSSLLFFAIIFVISSCKKEEVDSTPPVITLFGNSSIQIDSITQYSEPGATAIDDVDGDISSKIVITDNIDINTLGFYQVKYNVSDKAGNKAVEVIRTVQVVIF
ncbi:DUF5011 domain-containing protein [Bacteroidota bacterium]